MAVLRWRRSPRRPGLWLLPALAAGTAAAPPGGHSALLDEPEREVGQLLLEAYTFSEGGASRCPKGYSVVVDINTCTAAGEALGALDRTANELEKVAFAGCVIDEGRQVIYFHAPPPPDENATSLALDGPHPLPSNLGHVCKKTEEAAAAAAGKQDGAGHRGQQAAPEIGVEVLLALDGLNYDDLLGKGWKKDKRIMQSFDGKGKDPPILHNIKEAVRSALLEVLPSGVGADDVDLRLSRSSVTVQALVDASGSALRGGELRTFISEQAHELGMLASERLSAVHGLSAPVQASLVGTEAWRPPARATAPAGHGEHPQRRDAAAGERRDGGGGGGGGREPRSERLRGGAASVRSRQEAHEDRGPQPALEETEEKAQLGPHMTLAPRVRLELFAAAGLGAAAAAMAAVVFLARLQRRGGLPGVADGAPRTITSCLSMLSSQCDVSLAAGGLATCLEDQPLD